MRPCAAKSNLTCSPRNAVLGKVLVGDEPVKAISFRDGFFVVLILISFIAGFPACRY